MSDLVPMNVQIPAHLANRIGQPSALAQSIMGGITSGDSYPRISIKGSRFRIVEGGTETVMDTTALKVVIVGSNPRLSKTWYAAAWSKDAEPTAPDCYSLDGVGPHPDSTKPQNDLCASCPQNAWGSKTSQEGKQIKACADQKRLAVVAADDPTGPVYLLQVTPAALKGLNAYQKELAIRGIAPELIQTKISFDTDASFPKLVFSFGGFNDGETQEAVDKLFGSREVIEITGEKADVVRAIPQSAPKPVLVAPKPTPVVEAPAPTPAPVVEEAAAPKRGFGAATTEVKAAPKVVDKPAQTTAASTLASEILALVGEDMDADDA
jgi:hypothetical protein